MMKYEFWCNENENNKMKLIINLNKVVADLKRGQEAFNNVANDIDELKNELGQKSLIDNSKDTKIIAKKAKLKELEDKKDKFLKAINKLDNKYSLIAVELEDKFNIKHKTDFYIYGINLFEYIQDFKIVPVDN
jgi:chromosome segregation ATPase